MSDRETAPVVDRPGASRPDGARERFWAIGFPALTVLLTLSVPVLLVAGRNVMLHSVGGALEEQVTDPAAPGWRAITEPTPTALVVHRNGAGTLVGATLVSLTGTGSGAIVFVPVGTVARGPSGEARLTELAAAGDAALRAGIESLLGFAPNEVIAVDADGWREAVAGAEPLSIENPDDVFATGDHPALRFAKGALVLPAADVDDYLSMRNPGELDLNRLARHEAFWRGWLAAWRGAPAANADTDEPGLPLDRYVRSLADADVTISTLPASPDPGAPGGDRYLPAAGPTRELLARVVPYPPARGRPLRIRLLDGVGTMQHGQVAASRLSGGGGQIYEIGNAASFGVPRTKLEFADEDRRREVEALAAALGLGEVVKTNIEGSVDVVVTLGQDYPAAPGGTGG